MRGAKVSVAALMLWSGSAARAAGEAPICADRPSKGTGTCTVPPGNWQVETGLVDWLHDESRGAGIDFSLIGSSLIKYGLNDRTDVEVGVTPLALLRSHANGEHERSAGFGDMVVRAKYRLTADDAPVAVALDPVVKIPTAKHDLGNGKVEAGLTVPISAPLGRKSPLTLSLAPELDWRADGDGRGHHAAMIQLVNLGLAASAKLSLAAELWRQWDWDPEATGKQTTADGS